MSIEGNKLDSMMRKITSLLANADNPATPPPAADTYRAKAESLMKQYRIEESELAATMTIDAIRPVSREVPIVPAGSEFQIAYRTMFVYACNHVGVRDRHMYKFDEQGIRHIAAVIVGYESDLRFAEVIYQSARIVFADRMEPKHNPYESDMDNVFRMRSAGMERIRIAEVMGWVKGGAKVTRLYKQACEKHGVEPILTGRGMDVKAYREQYAQGFLSEFWRKLSNARNAADQDHMAGELVLANRAERVDEVFYGLYPEMRPSDAPATTSSEKPKRSRKWTKADEARWMRANSSAAQAGRNAGVRAASEVDVRGIKRATRLGE